MAKGAQLLVPGLNFYGLLVLFAGVSLLLQIFTTYARYARYLKYLALVLFAYMFSAFSVHMDWHSLFRATVVPSLTFSKDQLLLICAILGTTISPYLFFWQTSQEVEEEILRGEKTVAERKRSVTRTEIRDMRADVWSGMFVSNMVMFFIIAACAATLFSSGHMDIQTAADAASALRPFAGEWAYWLFALGIIGTGMLAIPVLAGSSSYALSESFGWKQGLYRKLGQAKAFYGVIIIAMVLGILLNLTSIDPINALIYSAVFNGIVSPFVLVLIVRLSSNKRVMGDYASGSVSKWVGWLTVVLMAVSGAAALASLFI
jgi:Mn2+/Fe2+ NRAMP family transporter